MSGPIITDPGQMAARARVLGDAGRNAMAALDGDARPIDVGTIALAVAIKSGKRRRAQHATDDEAIALAEGVLSLARSLISVWMLDRSAAYARGEADRFGQNPPAGPDGVADVWLTPREIAEATLPFLADAPLAAPAPAPETPIKEPANGP